MEQEKFINEVSAQTKAKIMDATDLLVPADNGETVEIEFTLPYGYEMIVMVNSGASRNIEDQYHVEIDLFRSNDKVAASGNQGCLEECNLEDQIIEFCYEQIGKGVINPDCAPVPSTQFVMTVFDVCKDTTDKQLSIKHENINSWELKGIHQEDDAHVANIRFTTKEPCSEDDLEGEVCVSVANEEIQGLNVYIDSLI